MRRDQQWGERRLPITVPPLAGEALDSWIEAYARRLQTCSRGLLNHLGLPGCQPRHMVVLLTDTERDTLAAATGTDAATLDAMTLRRFDRVAVTINPRRRIVEQPPTWRRHTGSRYCPACLAADGGRWQLTWRLPWTFACLRHHRLLADACPACRRRTHPDRPGHRGEPSRPGTCTAPAARHNRGPHTPACAHPLTDVATATLPPGGVVEQAARHIHQLIHTAVGVRTDSTIAGTADSAIEARRGLDDLFLLAHRALAALHQDAAPVSDSIRHVVGECGPTIPPPFRPLGPLQAHTVAVGATLAVIAHTGDGTGDETSDALLRWIVDQHHQLAAPEPNMLLRRWRHCGPALAARVLALFADTLRPQDRLAYATATPRPRFPQPGHTAPVRRAAALPALLWPAWSIRLIPATHGGDNALDSSRAALAALTLIPGTRVSYRHAADLLGGYTGPAAVGDMLQTVAADQLDTTIAAITQLADTLDEGGTPIDYARRRALFTTGTSVDRPSYAALTATYGWRPPSRLQLHLLDRHLAILLTGTAATTRVGPTRWGTANAFNPLTVALPAVVRRFVHDQARRLLHAHHIDEPLTWQPEPPPRQPHPPWPGVDPDRIDPRAFAAAFAEHANAARPLARLHEATGLSPIHLRICTELFDLDMPDTDWDTLADDPDGDPGGHLLNPARLRHLYHDRQLPLHDIAHRCLTTEPVIRRILSASGTHLPAHRPRRKPVTGEWFHQHYLSTGKTLRQAAAEAGVCRNTATKYARLHNIPTGPHAPPANPFASWPARHTPVPAVVAACSGPRGVDYVRQVLHMRRFRTQRVAAAALGIHETVLMRHRQNVERAAGIRIFQPATPLIPTPDGERFLHAAARALRRLDKLARTPAAEPGQGRR